MRITHVIESISPHFGGPPNVAINLAAAQAALGAEVEIVTYRDPHNDDYRDVWNHQISASRQLQIREIGRGWRLTNQNRRAFRALHAGTDVMHIHGIWRSLAWFALSGRRDGRAATVLAPHGMLSPWALHHNGFRKTLAMRALWKRLISAADALHAVSEGEGDEIRAVVSNAPIALIPNGVSSESSCGPTEVTAGSAMDRESVEGYVLYLARLHEMKGPDLLIDAFAEAVKGDNRCSGYRLIMAGPDFGEKAALQRRARRLGIEDRVHFPGAVFDKAKRDLYRDATLVCQPSRYEAFSLSLLEALAAGVPVLTTPEANFPEIQTHGAGIICRGEAGELAKHMRLMLSRPELRESMARQGRALVLNKYTWERIAMGALQVYANVLNLRAKSN